MKDRTIAYHNVLMPTKAGHKVHTRQKPLLYFDLSCIVFRFWTLGNLSFWRENSSTKLAC